MFRQSRLAPGKPQSGSQGSPLRELLLLAAACGFFFFFRLSAIGLLGPDEPRYAQVAREMLARHDWVTPVLYHHTWLEKPILLYWGEMLSYLVFGVSDWAARVPSATAATLLVFGTYLALRRLRPQASLDAALMIASSVLVFGFARAAATDMLLASMWCLSLLSWFCWYESATATLEPTAGLQRPPREKLYLYLFYILNALGMLAKGPVAPALAAFVLIAFCATRRNLRAALRSLDPVGIALFLAVAAPWYVLVQMRTPEFFRIFFLQHNLARFGSNLYRHRQPFWYYLPVALVAAIPWTIWMLHGVGDAFTALRARTSDRMKAHSIPASLPVVADGGNRSEVSRGLFAYGEGSGRPQVSAANKAARKLGHQPFTFEIYLLIWALVPIAFFSISRSKLPGYILPSIPALLILTALSVHRRADRMESPRWIAIGAHAVLLSVLAAATCLAPSFLLKLPISASTLMLAAVAGASAFFLVALLLLLQGWRYFRSITLLLVILIVAFVLRGLAPLVDSTQSARPVAVMLEQIRQSEQAMPLPVATFGLNRNTAFGLAFYLNQRVDPYEGLEISPAVYELPPAVPAAPHLLVVRDSYLPSLNLLLGNRTAAHIGSYEPQHIEIYEVSGQRQ